jgi:hypothetical protein
MKKLYISALLLAAGFSFGQTSDSFTGTGALNTNGWLTHSGTAGQLVISTGSLTYPAVTSTGNKIALTAGNSEDVNRASTAPLTGKVYYSAILNLPNTTGLGPNAETGDYFLANASAAGDAPNTVTAFSGRLYIKAGSAANTFNLGVLNNSGGTAAPTYITTDYAVNTPIFVVVKYDIATNTASLFVNPALSGTEGTANVTNATGTTAAPAQVASIVIRQGGPATLATGTGNVQIDELKLASTWAAVAPAGTAGVKQNEIANLKLFPNPLTGNVLSIVTNSGVEKTVAVFDVLGKQVINAKTVNGTVNAANLTAGVYVVKITEEGKTATRKLIVQ